MQKSELIYDIVQLIQDEVICFENMEEFSDDLKDAVRWFLDRR